MLLILDVINKALGVPEEFRLQYFLRDSISGSRIAKEVGVHAPARCSVEETKNVLINHAHWHEGLVKYTVTYAKKADLHPVWPCQVPSRASPFGQGGSQDQGRCQIVPWVRACNACSCPCGRILSLCSRRV